MSITASLSQTSLSRNEVLAMGFSLVLSSSQQYERITFYAEDSIALSNDNIRSRVEFVSKLLNSSYQLKRADYQLKSLVGQIQVLSSVEVLKQTVSRYRDEVQNLIRQNNDLPPDRKLLWKVE